MTGFLAVMPHKGPSGKSAAARRIRAILERRPTSLLEMAFNELLNSSTYKPLNSARVGAEPMGDRRPVRGKRVFWGALVILMTGIVSLLMLFNHLAQEDEQAEAPWLQATAATYGKLPSDLREHFGVCAYTAIYHAVQEGQLSVNQISNGDSAAILYFVEGSCSQPMIAILTAAKDQGASPEELTRMLALVSAESATVYVQTGGVSPERLIRHKPDGGAHSE